MAFDVSLLAKSVESLTPEELSQVDSYFNQQKTAVEARQKVIREVGQVNAFKAIASVVVAEMKGLGWSKMPSIKIVPNADGTDMVVDYLITRKPKTANANGSTPATRMARPDSGKITINKIIEDMGEVEAFEVAGVKYNTTKDVVKHLTNPKEKDSEANHCWELTKAAGEGKGISSSDIITNRHANEVKLVFKGGKKITVEDAVKAVKTARDAKAAQTPAADVPV